MIIFNYLLVALKKFSKTEFEFTLDFSSQYFPFISQNNKQIMQNELESFKLHEISQYTQKI